MKPEFYNIETFEKIMSLEESKGRLKEFCYSQETKAMSQVIKELRQELRSQKGEEREQLKLRLEEYKQQYEEQKKTEIAASMGKKSREMACDIFDFRKVNDIILKTLGMR